MGYKLEKDWLAVELKESREQAVRSVAVDVRRGHKCKAQAEVDQSISMLKHKEVMGRVQEGRAGFGWGEPVKFSSKISKKESKTMFTEEVTRVEHERYLIKAVSQGEQASWAR